MVKTLVWLLQENMPMPYDYFFVNLLSVSGEGLCYHAELPSVSVIVDGVGPSRLDYDY